VSSEVTFSPRISSGIPRVWKPVSQRSVRQPTGLSLLYVLMYGTKMKKVIGHVLVSALVR
jgi:hypothetical protein